MALNMMTRKVQGVSALSRPTGGVVCSPKVTVTRRSTIMRYKEDEVRTGGKQHVDPQATAIAV
jgi:hypothetical protein